MAGRQKTGSGNTGLILLGVGTLVMLGAGIAVGLWAFSSRGGGSQIKDNSNPNSPSFNLGTSTTKRSEPENEVRKAVDKGVAFLRKRVLTPNFAHDVPDTRYGKQVLPGVAALMGLTLLEAGADKDDEAVLRVAEIIRGHHKDMSLIYALSASLFFLNKWREVKELSTEDRNLARSLAARIISGQLKEGVWNYSGFAMNAEQEEAFLKKLAKHEFKPAGEGHYTISNTQFAMLALWGARTHDVEVRDTLLAAADFFNNHQTEDGHWIYSEIEAGSPQQPTLWTTSTAAGLISLAIEDALLNDKEFVKAPIKPDPNRKRADRDKAFKYVNKSIGRKASSPGGGTQKYRGTIFGADAWGDLYFLWCVERVGVIYKRDKFDDKGRDWYEWGYPIVLKNQKEDGSWNDKHGDVVDTCFALLFLLRANLAKDLTEKLQSLSLLGPRLEPAMSSRERTRTG